MNKVPSLKVLNAIVQKTGYKKIGNLMARYITRDMALPLTWVLLHFPISANAITLIAFVFGMAACLAFSFGTYSAMLYGAALLQLWYLFDHVDGQIARYRKEISVTGVFLDYIAHHLIHIGIFAGMGWGVYILTSDAVFILIGMIAALNILILNLIYDCQYKAFFHAITKNIIPKKNIKYFSISNGDNVYRQSIIRRIFSFIHKLCEVHVVMNIITLLAILGFLFKACYVWDKFILFYLMITAIAGIVKASYFIIKGIPDKEYAAFLLEYEKFKR